MSREPDKGLRVSMLPRHSAADDEVSGVVDLVLAEHAEKRAEDPVPSRGELDRRRSWDRGSVWLGNRCLVATSRRPK